jgi:hypothetical protein
MTLKDRRAARIAVVIAALVASLFGAGLSGCSSSPYKPPNIAEPSVSGMRKLETPPTSPPKVSVNGTDLDPASFDWWTEGVPTTFRAANRQEDVPLQSIEAEDVLDFRTNSTVLPREAVIAVFIEAELDRNGIPTNNVGQEIDCLDPKSAVCHPHRDANGVGFKLSLEKRASIAVLHLSYFLLEGEAESLEGHILTGAWGIRLEN